MEAVFSPEMSEMKIIELVQLLFGGVDQKMTDWGELGTNSIFVFCSTFNRAVRFW